MSKAVSGYVNLVQKLAIALSEREAEAEVRYVPVSKTPYVRIVLGSDYDALDDLRERICLELATRGFGVAGGTELVKETDGGFLYVHVESPAFDSVERKAVLSVSVSGPYEVRQQLSSRKRDKPAERAQFRRDVAQKENDDFWTLQGMNSIVRSMLFKTPFKIPVEHLSRIGGGDRDVQRRVAVALASQSLESFDDLVEKAELHELLGIEPACAPSP